MVRHALTLLLAVAACGPHAPPAAPHSDAIAIVGVTVVHPALDGAAAETPDQTVVVDGDRIVAAGPSATVHAPPGARAIDGRGKWLIPGLVDSHVHFFQSANPFTRPDVIDFTDIVPYAQEVARNKVRLPVTFQIWLASGVTSVIDDGGPMWNFTVRDEAQHSTAAPRVEVAGPLISIISRHPLDLDDPPIVECKTPDDARALVAKELPHHPDFIKAWFIHEPTGDLAAEAAIVHAAADAAHAAHTRMMVHATELATAKEAIRAGADILVHSVTDTDIDDEFIALAREHHVILLPTLWVGGGYNDTLAGHFEPTEAEARLGDPQILAEMHHVPRPRPPRRGRPEPAALANLPKLWAAGVTIALGTDAGNIGTLHGPSVFREAQWMVKAGLTPAMVLRSATVNGAKVLGLDQELGDVAVGRRSDLVLLDADPLASVDNLSHASLVVRAGRAFVPAEILQAIRAMH